MYRSQIKFLFLFLFIGCGAEVPTSFENDSLSASCDGDTAFVAACALIQTKCINCHQGQHDSWTGWTEDDFVASGRVVAGDPGNSSIYTELINVSGAMPPSTSFSWSTAETTIIENWINDIP